MVTFTLPRELRSLAKANQRVVYALQLEFAVATLKDFGNEQGLAAEPAMTAALHTQSRRLDYHPHVHVIVPCGGVDTRLSEWRRLKGKYLFHAFSLATVWRGKLLLALRKKFFGSDDGEFVTFQYRESRAGAMKTHHPSGEGFARL